MDIRPYTVDELEEMDTLWEGHSLDCKVEERGFRVTLDRTGDEGPVMYEFCIHGRWHTAEVDEDGDGFTVHVSFH